MNDSNNKKFSKLQKKISGKQSSKSEVIENLYETGILGLQKSDLTC